QSAQKNLFAEREPAASSCWSRRSLRLSVGFERGECMTAAPKPAPWRPIPPPVSIEAATEAYEAWLRTRCDVVEADLAAKHDKMAQSPFLFLRATFYRWAGCIEALLPQLASAPRALCVGDAHVENFGAWRDADGRLAWGVNDFDEAAETPCAFDLVRL